MKGCSFPCTLLLEPWSSDGSHASLYSPTSGGWGTKRGILFVSARMPGTALKMLESHCSPKGYIYIVNHCPCACRKCFHECKEQFQLVCLINSPWGIYAASLEGLITLKYLLLVGDWRSEEEVGRRWENATKGGNSPLEVMIQSCSCKDN